MGGLGGPSATLRLTLWSHIRRNESRTQTDCECSHSGQVSFSAASKKHLALVGVSLLVPARQDLGSSVPVDCGLQSNSAAALCGNIGRYHMRQDEVDFDQLKKGKKRKCGPAFKDMA